MLIDKIKGCLIGGAIGDALGFPVEFMTKQQIITRYGKNGITDYDLDRGNGEALFSDDTQMSVYTVTALIKCKKENSNYYAEYIYKNYLDWVKFQCDENCKIKPFDWVSEIKSFRAYRIPGSTCVSALSSEIMGTIEKPINFSKGCGGIMRVAPIGLFFNNKKYNILNIDMLGAKTAAITHGHPLGYISSFVLVHIINRIVFDDFEITEAALEGIKYANQVFNNIDDIKILENKINKSIKLASNNIDDGQAFSILGEGWVAEETLAIALYCSLKYKDDFSKAICAAVNHNGDSDSTGAVCGNILGSYLGFNNIPSNFLKNLEAVDYLNKIANEIYNCIS